jgi:acetyl-CoA C-acetyltransferase
VAELVGAKRARTQLAEIGVLQTTLFARACTAIADGRAEVVLVTGGEAKHRAGYFERSGGQAPITDSPGAVPDEVWRPAGDILAPVEIASHLGMPVRQYAVIENAMRFAEGRSLDVHRNEIASLWSDMSRVAAENPDAWTRDFVTLGQIRDAGAGNRMLAFPYTKLHNSQWNVDQAAGLIFTSAALARREGVPASQWIHPRAVVESNYMLPLVHRAELHRCAAFRIAGRRAAELASLRLAQLAHLELYSCFPVAVRVQQRELGIPRQQSVTVTGGMAFAGGPLNNFVLQAAVRLAQLLREGPGAAGMLNAVSGMLTKQGVSLWSSRAGPAFATEDVSEQAERETPRVPVIESFSGTARIEGYTVLYQGDRAAQTIVLCDTGSGARAVAVGADAALAEAAVSREIIGSEVSIGSGGVHLAH